ncbi:alkaline phosphatase family protein [Geomonas propionica]|uniref:Alkaline phosphatase family protein n=1 Tax=Geomonas propionica TaxID=2798582 RepID=A0ABS0YVK0_9BACT|nr:alkaline phosphatase family protein [Geomonas propionica]MBJ6801948.1 alkaline phosphatase family protein [Geomonas propionica]
MSGAILIGIDGMDPGIADAMLGRGELPNFERLAARGSYSRLATLNPPQSPVVWSSIATGLSPGQHGIHDFIHRDPQTYRPYLSLHRMEQGRYVNPVNGETFWEKAARQGRDATLLKWPMGFPPRPFAGRMLAGLGVPDLRGMLGSYSLYTSAPEHLPADAKGRVVPIASRNCVIQTDIAGPFTVGLTGRKTASAPLRISIDGDAIVCRIGRQSFTVATGQWSPWISIPFDTGLFSSVSGLCRFFLRSVHPEFALYMTPVNVPYQAEQFPVSHPPQYASELAGAIGDYATLGMAEDTNAVNDGALDEDAFISLCDGIMAEREAMFLHELGRFREGLLACVFDTTDRIQHIFWRMHDQDHPAYDEKLAQRYRDVIPRYYRWMDRILGVVMERAPKVPVMCCSDHGFGSFRRSVHLNSWLAQRGYLALQPGTTEGGALLQGVDWAKTTAYAIGFTSIYLNIKGREQKGSLAPQEAPALKERLIKELEEFKDRGQKAVLQVHDVSTSPGGNAGPDLVPGFAAGYRASWQTALGGAPAGDVVEDNLKKWSGDHCCDASLVPGVIFSNAPLSLASPCVTDVAELIATLTPSSRCQ